MLVTFTATHKTRVVNIKYEREGIGDRRGGYRDRRGGYRDREDLGLSQRDIAGTREESPHPLPSHGTSIWLGSNMKKIGVRLFSGASGSGHGYFPLTPEISGFSDSYSLRFKGIASTDT
eukprot:sb/3476294/